MPDSFLHWQNVLFEIDFGDHSENRGEVKGNWLRNFAWACPLAPLDCLSFPLSHSITCLFKGGALGRVFVFHSSVTRVKGRHSNEITVKGAALAHVGKGQTGQMIDPVLPRHEPGPVDPLPHGNAGPCPIGDPRE